MTDAGVAVEWPQICVLGGQVIDANSASRLC